MADVREAAQREVTGWDVRGRQKGSLEGIKEGSAGGESVQPGSARILVCVTRGLCWEGSPARGAGLWGADSSLYI